MTVGGMRKSAALLPEPFAVITRILPEPVSAGTIVLSVVAVTAVTLPERLSLNRTVVAPGDGSKVVPVTVTMVPGVPEEGVKPVTVGTPAVAAVITKSAIDVAVPAGEVTETLPVVAVVGTVTNNLVVVAVTIAAVTPLNLTVFCAAVALKPVPLMVTEVPAGPLLGVNSRIEMAAAPKRQVAQGQIRRRGRRAQAGRCATAR